MTCYKLYRGGGGGGGGKLVHKSSIRSLFIIRYQVDIVKRAQLRCCSTPSVSHDYLINFAN